MNPKRRFFQIHLSTAVVLMLVAGVLVWANVREHSGRGSLRREIPVLGHLYSNCRVYGWPEEAVVTFDRFFISDADEVREGFWAVTREDGTGVVTLRNGLFYNCSVTIVALLGVCVACEWRIRRREARKANE